MIGEKQTFIRHKDTQVRPVDDYIKPSAIVLHGRTSAGKSSIASALQDCLQSRRLMRSAPRGCHVRHTATEKPMISMGVADVADVAATWGKGLPGRREGQNGGVLRH
ncbi:hypothetical protein [Ottowia thiooxydans]|uniref:hypothetical protein n=1 Tax=Ottowia thiooxydans TaxID=219182 RepID=UPI00048F46E7|nr:hypothetical protein [Ottowia thiooxydans]